MFHRKKNNNNKEDKINWIFIEQDRRSTAWPFEIWKKSSRFLSLLFSSLYFVRTLSEENRLRPCPHDSRHFWNRIFFVRIRVGTALNNSGERFQNNVVLVCRFTGFVRRGSRFVLKVRVFKNIRIRLDVAEKAIESFRFWDEDDYGRFPFSQNFRKFRFGKKWETFRRFVPLETDSREKWNLKR